jgi:5-methyltetrahydrofolate--homocysteine methyltransferase
MTDTLVSSATREVVIGFDRPFVIIGERINPTGRKILAAEMAAGNFERVSATRRCRRRAHARRQRRYPAFDEPAILARGRVAVDHRRRCRSIRRSSPRSRPGSPSTRASRS